MKKFYGIVRFSIREGELEEFRVECIDWLDTKEECINEFNANGSTVYAVFTEEELVLLKQDLNVDLVSKVM